jgi:putative ABC transport system permease protein
MLSLTITSIKAKKFRFVLTSVAVMLGVAFMAGTLVLTDTLKKSFDDIAANVYRDTDAVVRSSRHVQGENDVKEVRATLDASVLDRVRHAPGVRAAEAEQVGAAVVVGHDGNLVDANPNRSVPVALAWAATPELNPMEVVAGHAPRAANDVVIDRATERKGHFRVGETVKVLGPTGAHEYRLSGVVTYGGADNAAGAQVLAFTPETAAKVFGTPGRYQSVLVVAEPGVRTSQLLADLRSKLGPGYDVISGAEATADARNATGTSLQFVDMFLMTFAIVALVVGSFVIHNTFSITVAQRTRETALLRAIGAKRKQVTRSVVAEALFTGVFASVVGAAAGVGMASGLRWVLHAFGMEFSARGMVVQGGSLTIAIVTGVIVTVAAAYLPARRAAKVAPIEAMRDVAVEPARASMRRTVLGVLVTVGGAALIGRGLAGGDAGSIGLGALAVFVGVSTLGPAIARPFVRVFGLPIAKARGMAGTLARENASRNPKRSASTASALMIGVGLVVMMTVFAASTKASIADSIDVAMKGDYIVQTQFGMGGISPQVARRIDALPETRAVTSLRYGTATVAGAAKDISGFDPATVDETVVTKLPAGAMSHLGLHDVAVHEDEAKARHVTKGDTVTLTFPETRAQRFRVAAVYGTKQPFGKYALSLQAFEKNIVSKADDAVVIANSEGVSMQQAHRAIERVLADYPTAELMDRDQFKGEVASQIDQILNLVYVLLAMALVIAFFGIANTLALSVFERTRELGLLRAVGMARAQVRSTVRIESVLVALLGTTLGTAIGLGFSWALVQALHDKGIDVFTMPGTQLAGIVGVAVVAAVVAAALPARRAARLDVLHAIAQ